MARRWSTEEEFQYKKEMVDLYCKKNLSIKEIATLLQISQASVFVRLKRLGIKSAPEKKKGYLNKRSDIKIPKRYSSWLAEMFGILLGDGHISEFQVIVSLGSKESEYASYVSDLMKHLFGGAPKIGIRGTSFNGKKYRDVYLGSTQLVTWLKAGGLVQNKVQSQVGVPIWILSNRSFIKAFLRGFFDTDGSVYRLKYGLQISFTNRSKPILLALQSMLEALEYKPSQISSNKVYLTDRVDLQRFFREIKPKNSKHVSRFTEFNASVV